MGQPGAKDKYTQLGGDTGHGTDTVNKDGQAHTPGFSGFRFPAADFVLPQDLLFRLKAFYYGKTRQSITKGFHIAGIFIGNGLFGRSHASAGGKGRRQGQQGEDYGSRRQQGAVQQHGGQNPCSIQDIGEQQGKAPHIFFFNDGSIVAQGREIGGCAFP